MAVEELSQDRIRDLYRLYQVDTPWRTWFENFIGDVQAVSQASPDDLSTPEWQARLWALKGVASLGQGEHVDVRGAYNDTEVVNAIIGLRRRWPEEPNARAKAIQAAFDRIIDRVREEHAKMRPQAKLGRLFMAMLPAENHAGFSWDSNRHVQKLVLGARRGLGYLESAVLVRLRLRSILGPEQGLEEHVERAIFCWWLHIHFDAIARGENPPVEDPKAEVDEAPGGEEQEEVELLELWPISKQIKGITLVPNYQEGYRAVVAAAEQGASPEDIVETMRSDLGFEGHAPKTCRRVFNQVRRRGFLEHRGGLWYPSEKGERLLNEDPPDILVEEFLVKFFGLGHLLRLIADRGPLFRKDAYEAMQAIYPSWSSTYPPGAVTLWALALGLLEGRGDRKVALTDYGRSWEQRLPRPLPTPTPPSRVDRPMLVADDAPPIYGTTTGPWPTLPQILEAFRSDRQARRFLFTDDQIRGLHLAWHSQPKKRFVLLSGLSGTGKTQILLHYSRLYCQILDLGAEAVDRHRAVVAVSPDWRDPSGLIGYFNALHSDPTFQVEPALRLVLAAARYPDLPFFLVLDEMNLARVERYFAPFLSAMESGEELVLHAHDEAINDVPPTVKWPRNLFIGGTVNMDETTHPFSDKVLDRAFTLEFWDVDLEAFFDRRDSVHQAPRLAETEALLVDINDLLRPIRRHFGYRSADEVLSFVEAAATDGHLDADTRCALTDQAVFAKVLPRLRGTESPPLHTAFDGLRRLCERQKLSRCLEKLQAMQSQLQATGVTRFWS